MITAQRSYPRPPKLDNGPKFYTRSPDRQPCRVNCTVLVEGGASLHQSLWDSGLVDRVQIFRTPHYLGPPGVVWLPFLATGNSLRGVTTTPLGADTLIEGHVHGTD